MNESERCEATPERRAREPEGLCPSCAHVRRIRTDKGSTFWMCERSRDDARYPRYPAQPRMVCDGHER